MLYCVYNAIQTPDGTVLWCQTNHDYKTHLDVVSGEFYMNDGTGFCIRRSTNKVPYIDKSKWFSSDDPDNSLLEIRDYPFWGTYGKTGNEPKKFIALSKMTDEHIENILSTQWHIRHSIVEIIFLTEQKYRKQNKIRIKE